MMSSFSNGSTWMSLERSRIARKIREGANFIAGPSSGAPAGEKEVFPRIPDRDLSEQVDLGGKGREVLRHIVSRLPAHLASVVPLPGAALFSGRILSTSRRGPPRAE